jgi:hypothetical protein
MLKMLDRWLWGEFGVGGFAAKDWTAAERMRRYRARERCEMNPQLGLFPRSPSQRVPALTEAMRLALEAVELAGGGVLCEPRVSRSGGGEAYEVDARVLKRLIREGLIEVMGLAPAVYRVMKLGRLARSMR